MEAHPKVGDTYRQEFYVGHAEDIAQMMTLHANVTVPFGTFHHALEATECTRLEPGVAEDVGAQPRSRRSGERWTISSRHPAARNRS